MDGMKQEDGRDWISVKGDLNMGKKYSMTEVTEIIHAKCGLPIGRFNITSYKAHESFEMTCPNCGEWVEINMCCIEDPIGFSTDDDSDVFYKTKKMRETK